MSIVYNFACYWLNLLALFGCFMLHSLFHLANPLFFLTVYFAYIGIVMVTTEIVDLSSDDESEEVGPIVAVKLETDYIADAKQHNETDKDQLARRERSRSHATRQDAEGNISSNAPSTGHSNSSVLEQGSIDDTGISYASSIGVAPVCRQFWKAGDYDDGLDSKVTVQSNSCTCVFVYSN